MRYLITISYDGTDFSGYQKQPKERTVQSELEKALKEINGGKKVDVHASGRTDAGVHALNQKVHFDLETKITPDKLVRGLNSLLPNDIYVKDVKEVPEDFHARFSAIGKEYIYKLNMGEYNPLERNYVYQHNKKLDVIEMERAMKYLEGEHNFKSFTKTDEEKDDENDQDVIIEKDVWIGANVTILKGVTVAEGCVIGAGTVLTKSTHPYGIYVGVPGRRVSERFTNEELENHINILQEKSKWWF